MNATLISATAHALGAMRFGRHSVPGQQRMVDALGRCAAWLGEGQGIATPSLGVRFKVNLNDRIQRQMWAATYEPHVRSCFEALLCPGDVYVDVGGHVGYHAVFAAQCVGPQGRIYAFEADPGMFQSLSEA